MKTIIKTIFCLLLSIGLIGQTSIIKAANEEVIVLDDITYKITTENDHTTVLMYDEDDSLIHTIKHYDENDLLLVDGVKEYAECKVELNDSLVTSIEDPSLALQASNISTYGPYKFTFSAMVKTAALAVGIILAIKGLFTFVISYGIKKEAFTKCISDIFHAWQNADYVGSKVKGYIQSYMQRNSSNGKCRYSNRSVSMTNKKNSKKIRSLGTGGWWDPSRPD